MTESDDKNLIKITHYINPHMFWYKYETSFFTNDKLFALENNLQQHFFTQKAKPSVKCYKPIVDEIVAVFNFSYNRWIRAKCDHISEYTIKETKYVMWAIDYGIPFQTDAKWIRALPEEFLSNDANSVFFGGLGNVIPSEKIFDFEKNEAEMIPSKNWSPIAVRTIENLINFAASIKFVPNKRNKEGQYFGHLEVLTNTNKTIKSDLILLKINQAMITENIFQDIREIGTNVLPRWQTNDGNSFVSKYNVNKLSSEQIKYEKILVAGTKNNLEMIRSDIDSEVERKVSDWEKRNQVSRLKEEITIDDISFNDSASVKISHNDPKVNHIHLEEEGDDIEEQLYMVAGTSRKKRLEKYRKSLPRTPINTPSSVVTKDSLSPQELKLNTPTTSKPSQTPESQKTKTFDSSAETDHISIISQNDKMNESSDKSIISVESTSNAVNALVNRLANKRKLMQAKLSERPIVDNKVPLSAKPAGFDLRNIRSCKDVEKEVKNKQNHTKMSYKTNNYATTNGDNLSSKLASRLNIGENKIHTSSSFQNTGEICVQSNLTKDFVLVHGKHIANPIDKLGNANFCDEVHRELEDMRINQIYRIQSYTWPHLMRGNSLIVVNSARTGKTMSYLPAVCSLVKMKSDDELVPGIVGPIGIIIANSCVEVEKITRYCRRFIGGRNQSVRIVESYGIRSCEKTKLYLLNGCDILVATPLSLSRLLTDDLKFFDFKRIRHVVVDNIDMIHPRTRVILDNMLNKCCSLNEPDSVTPVQVVITTRYWDPSLSIYLRKCYNPQLCIGAYIEAAVYGRFNNIMKFIQKKSKTQVVLDFIKQHPYLSERLIIICNKNEEVEEVVEELKNASYFFLSCCSSSTAHEIELTKEWHNKMPGDMDILVCTDHVLPELRVRTAQNLIHYSLPLSWSKFVFRFSVFFGYFENFVITEEMTKASAISFILLDENNNQQLPKLVDFLEIHQKLDSIKPEILSLCKKIRIEREEERIAEKREFCPNIMEFGKCIRINECRYRHELTRYDKPAENIPKSGKIKFKVLEVITPHHYYVRLLEHVTDDGNWEKIKRSEDYLRFGLEFFQYFSDVENHQTHWPINVNDLCVVIELNTYYRCRVVEVAKSRLNGKTVTDVKVRVRLVDVGRVITCRSSNILVLPEHFCDYPFQAIDIRLLGIVPCDYEQEWETKATLSVRNWISKVVNDNMYIEANVVFSLLDTIWVKNIFLCEKLISISGNVTLINIKKNLLEKQFAMQSYEAEATIRQMALELGIFKNEEKLGPTTSTPKKNDKILGDKSTVSDSTLSKSVSIDSFHGINNKKTATTSTDCSCRTGMIVKDLNQRPVKKPMKKEGTSDASTNVGTERWEFLPEEEFCRVSVGTFYTPNQFYVQNLANLEKLESLYTEIDKFVSTSKSHIYDPKIGLHCLAKHEDKYNRAKITKVLCDAESNQIKVALFFCDIGMISNLSFHDIINSNPHIVNFMPFQAIRCKLTGISASNHGLWTEEISDKIYDDIIDNCFYLYARPVKTEEPNKDSDVRYWKHEVVLLDCSTENDVKINEKIVEKGLACYDPETKHFLNMITNMNSMVSSNDENDSDDWDDCNYMNPIQQKDITTSTSVIDQLNIMDLDIQFSQEDILKMLNLPPMAKILPPANILEETLQSRFEEIPNDEKILNKNEEPLKKEDYISVTDISSKESTLVDDIPIQQLKVLYKSPQVIWQQSDTLICLNISAPDIDDYYLKVTSTDLIFVANIENQVNMVLLNFCGCIIPNLISHEIRGLKVIVRLSKALKGFSWPRLTWESDKLSWLKYNYDCLVVEQARLPNTGRRIDSYEFSCSDLFDSSESEEEMIYDGHGKDVFDPFDDDF